MKKLIKQKQIIKPTNCWCDDVRPESGIDDHMIYLGARGASM